MDPVERNDAMAERMQHTSRHAPRYFSVDVTHPVPRVVTTVEPDRDSPAGLEQPGQHLKSLLAVWSVVQNSNAVDEIETLRRKRKMENIGLKYRRLASSKIASRNFRRRMRQ